MSNQTLASAFPASQQDISQLKKTATDAAADLSSTAAAHAAKAKGQFRDLAGHVQEEGGEQLEQIKSSMGDLVSVARNFAAERPLACIGTALAVGLFLGFLRRRS